MSDSHGKSGDGLQEQLKINIWSIQDPTKKFPEQEEGYVTVDEKSVGLAISGGGSRAFTCAVGYLRGLKRLSLNDKASYISCVSGGCWASSVYCFADVDETSLLGEDTDPSTLSLEFLEKSHGTNGEKYPGRMANEIPQFAGVEDAIKDIFKMHIRAEKLWQYVIGQNILQNFDLANKLVAMHHEHATAMLAGNSESSELQNQQFVYPQPNRPFIIMNATLDGPVGYSTGAGVSLQFTPLYGGAPFYPDNKKSSFTPITWFSTKFRLFGKRVTTKKLILGGGTIDTFAYGCPAPVNDADLFGGRNVPVKPPREFFMLEDCVGASSAAFVDEFEDAAKILGKVNPRSLYWPVLSKSISGFDKRQKAQDIVIADGGDFENTGLLALLQRGIKKAICFVNSSLPIDTTFFEQKKTKFIKMSKSGKISYQCCDDQLLALFGLVKYAAAKNAYNYSKNQVFEPSAMTNVLKDLITSLQAGKGAISLQKLKLVSNSYWNILGNDIVEVLFVYNSACGSFVDDLEKTTKQELTHANEGKGKFANFPYFATTRQNRDDVFGLSQAQVGLLSANAEHIIMANAETFQGMFKK